MALFSGSWFSGLVSAAPAGCVKASLSDPPRKWECDLPRGVGVGVGVGLGLGVGGRGRARAGGRG